MSKAFTREDVDPPERKGRKRSSSGLPPGAVNYITRRGATRLQEELGKLRATANNPERVAELEGVLGSIQIVDPPESPSKQVNFGATVTLQEGEGKTFTATVLGVEELSFEPDGISWISPLGRALLAARLGERVSLENGRTARIVRIDNR